MHDIGRATQWKKVLPGSEARSRVKRVPEHLGFSLADILVLAGTDCAGRIAPPASTRISAPLKRVPADMKPLHPNDSPVNTRRLWLLSVLPLDPGFGSKESNDYYFTQSSM